MLNNRPYENTGDEELWHYGIPKMSWGVRNGPPYPLTGAAKKMSSFLRKKKRQYAVEAKAKRTLKEQKAQEKLNLKKQKMLAKGNMKAISRNATMFTNDELAAALERNDLLIEAKHAPNRRTAPDPHAFDKMVNAADKIGQMAKSVSPALDVALKVAELSAKGKDSKAKDAAAASKAVADRFAMLKSVDENSALDFFNQAYGTDYAKKRKGTFDTSIFNALAQIDPNAAATYLNDYTGGSASVNKEALKSYIETAGKLPSISGGGGKKKDKED